MGADPPDRLGARLRRRAGLVYRRRDTSEPYSEPLFLGHLLGGIMYAAGSGGQPAAAGPGAVAVPPKIASITPSVRGSRVAVSVRTSGCTRCAARVQVELSRGSLTTPLHLSGATATGTTAVHPSGRWQLAVVLTNRATGLSRTAHRWVRVG